MKKFAFLLGLAIMIGAIGGCADKEESVKVSMTVKNQSDKSVKGSELAKAFLEKSSFGRVNIKSDGPAYFSVVVIEKYDSVTTREHFAVKELEKGKMNFDFGLRASVAHQENGYGFSMLEWKSSLDLQKASAEKNAFNPPFLNRWYPEEFKEQNLIQGMYGMAEKEQTLELGEPLFLFREIYREDEDYSNERFFPQTIDEILMMSEQKTPYIRVVGIVVTEEEPPLEEKLIISYNPLINNQRNHLMKDKAKEDAKFIQDWDERAPYRLR